MSQNSPDRMLGVSIGNAFLLYSCEKLNIMQMSPYSAEKITGIQLYKEMAFTSLSSSQIIAWKKNKIVTSFGPFEHPIRAFLVLANTLIVLCAHGHLFVHQFSTAAAPTPAKKSKSAISYDTAKNELSDEEDEDQRNEDAEAKHIELSLNATLLIHPPTYLNKVVIAGKQRMQLWNVQAKTLVYEFEKIPRFFDADVTHLEAGPVVDTAAIATSS